MNVQTKPAGPHAIKAIKAIKIKRELEPPYGRYAFLNPYNLSLFGGLVLAGLLSGHHWIVVVACAAEIIWMICAPSSTILRHIWFDRAFERAERAYAEERCKAKVAQLAVNDHARLAHLAGQQSAIERLAKENPSLTVDLLHDELAKLDALLEDFVALGVNAGRAEQHATTFDFPAMRRSWHIYEQAAKQYPIGDPRRAVAEKNLSVLRRRRARYDDLCRSIQVARGQMELIEQTFCLLADEIMTMASPRELGGRIDELRVAVDAVRETADETSQYECEDIEIEWQGNHEAHR
jgi:hypothetical protein